MRPSIHVFILTSCRKPELFYGTALIFRTLRTGFPTARITVVDNASLPEVRPELERLARETGCEFRQVAGPAIAHDAFLEATLAQVSRDEGGTLVFLDPDICLWANCEGFQFPGLLAGKLLDAFEDGPRQCVTMPRLHTSFLWVPDTRALSTEIRRLRAVHFDFRPFLSFSVKLGDAWIRYDTGAALYAAIADRVSWFTEEHFEHYDHLFGGTHLDLLESQTTTPVLEMMRRLHAHARAGNLAALRGVWRHQAELWWASYRPPHLEPPEPAAGD